MGQHHGKSLVTVGSLLDKALEEDWPLGLRWKTVGGKVKDTGKYPEAVRRSDYPPDYPTLVIPAAVIAAIDPQRKAS
jgi:hypothetical protein